MDLYLVHILMHESEFSVLLLESTYLCRIYVPLSNELINGAFPILFCRHARSNSLPREVNHNKIVPASQEQELCLSVPNEATQVTSNRTSEVQALDQSAHDIKQMNTEAHGGIQESSLNGEEKSSRRNKHRLCCFSM